MRSLTFIFLIIIKIAFAQELLRNSSFEENCFCSVLPPLYPPPTAQFNCTQWDVHFQSPNLENTYNGSVYFNTCSNRTDTCYPGNTASPNSFWGYKFPHTGNAFIGIYTCNNDSVDYFHNIRYFANQKLSNVLLNEAKYDVSLYISFSNHYNVFNNSLQVLFSDSFPYVKYQNPPGSLLNLESFHPQIDFKELGYQLNEVVGWKQIKGNFIANGTEQYITIGNYKNNDHSDTVYWGNGKPEGFCGKSWSASFYFIDDLSLTLGIDAGKDTVICANDTNTPQLKASAGWQHYTWINTTGATVGNTRAISINTPGTYIVTGTVDSLPNYSKKDTVVVSAYNIAPALFAAHAPNDTTVCAQTPVTLNIINPSNTLSYWWQPKSSTAPSITVNDSGLYTVRIYGGTCYKTDSVTVNYYSNQQSLIDSNIIHINNLNNTITANSGFTNYEWRDENNELIATTQSTSYTPVIAANAATSIFISAINAEGCLIKDTLQVIYSELPIIIPNPQIIGKGGTFKILNLPPNSSVILYDAMGQIVFEQNNYTNNFNLDVIAEGIFFYEIKTPNQSMIKGKLLLLKK